MSKLTYDDFKNRISIQDVLIDAGYTHYRRDGLRYPSYVRLDNQGKRIPGDKFIVTANGLCCFQPPAQRNYNVIGFIKEHPELFAEYTPGMDKDRLVNLVCNRLLNHPMEERETRIVNPSRTEIPFNINDYVLHRFDGKDRESQKPFYAYFQPRGIDLRTQYAFHHSFLIAEHTTKEGHSYRNLSFPMYRPDDEQTVVGFEERGRRKLDGSSYKGMAKGSNASEGLWLSSPMGTSLKDAQRVIVFESAYDAMAFYQLLTRKRSNLEEVDKKELSRAVFASTGGNPSKGQIQGLIRNAPNATFHIAFDQDKAGLQFTENFISLARSMDIDAKRLVREEPSEGYKDFNEELLDKKTESITDVIETVFDDDGVDLTIEEKDENEEVRHHAGRR